ncbi:polyhydroxyalkanoate synthesis repressor PhaR [Aquabacterium soli]|uniref:Polyhydroxyalkanoate synthesis repressor PhaR n=1 Tax=Aquabacterium soli TaxID=2493092 RepID=A0A426VFT0_9BURK|nr:polyhydroxyalkanoate synthesis repressor PhaR [Aquabacterium soli]RRS05570.1 polyhydroxyalkanoate synthesis repressor PhaR [Aquabacterium soli]
MSTNPRTRRTASSTEGAPEAAGEGGAPPPGVRAIKKYPNRRLYDTQTSSYITLADVKDMVMAVEHFIVLDAKTGEDLTRSILLQIILEEETGGVPMFSTQALAQIIRFYGHTMQGVMGNYLEKNIQSFIDMQARLTENAVVKLPNPVQSFMTSYMEQSSQIFTQMQEQMAKQAETLIGAIQPIPPKK